MKLLVTLLALALDPTQEAERLASQAVKKATTQPQEALADARRALALTEEFEPTTFVHAGRKGEVVEDAYVAARSEYRHHRARLYGAVGECLLAAGRPGAAVRYLGRASLLDPSGVTLPRLARGLVAAGNGRAALAFLGRPEAHPSPSDLEAAADAAGVPSAQAEIDRLRILSQGLIWRDGPFAIPAGIRLSTGGPLLLTEPGTTIVYEAEASCRTCSEDLLLLKKVAGPGLRVAVVPEVSARDQALREELRLYHLGFPILVGPGVSESLRLSPRYMLLVARSGWAGVEVRPPFSNLAGAVKALSTLDLQETPPRPAWNHRPVDRTAPPSPPGLLPEGLAPGEDLPPPAEFEKAVEAFRAGRAREALTLFETLAARPDGWLLPPEARLDKALCLSRSGEKDRARKILLRTGDSRLQDAVDRALETMANP